MTQDTSNSNGEFTKEGLSTPPQGASRAITAASPMPRSLFQMTKDQYDRLDMLADWIFQSALAIAKNGSNKLSKSDIKLVILKGWSLGMNEMVALESIDFIAGKPTLDGQGMMGLVFASGLLEDMQIDSNDQRCIVTMKRKGVPTPYTTQFGVEEATAYKTSEWVDGVKKTISLIEKDNYKNQRATMFKWRAVPANLRVLFADVVLGLYTQEEMGANVVVEDNGRMTVIIPEQPLAHFLDTKAGQERLTKFLNDELGYTKDQKALYLEKLSTPEKPVTGFKETGLNEEALYKRLREIAADINKPASPKSQSTKKTGDVSQSPVTTEEKAEPPITEAGRAWTDELYEEFSTHLFNGFQQLEQEFLTLLGKTDYRIDYPTLEAAWKDSLSAAIKAGWPMYADSVIYDGKVMEFKTPRPIVMYGRSTEFKQMVGDEYYAEWGIGDWQPSDTPYEIGLLKITYEEKVTKQKVAYLNATKCEPVVNPFEDAIVGEDLDEWFCEKEPATT